jgi:hypothetical protein
VIVIAIATAAAKLAAKLVVARSDAPPVFQFAEYPFDLIMLFAGNGTEGMKPFRVLLLGMTGGVPRSIRKRRSPSLSQAVSAAKVRARQL